MAKVKADLPPQPADGEPKRVLIATAERRIPLRWVFPEDVKGRVATNIVVQHTKDSFIVSFFEEMGPVIVGTPEERAALSAKVETIEARCVARIRMTPEKARDFVRALSENLSIFDTKTSKGLTQ